MPSVNAAAAVPRATTPDWTTSSRSLSAADPGTRTPSTSAGEVRSDQFEGGTRWVLGPDAGPIVAVALLGPSASACRWLPTVTVRRGAPGSSGWPRYAVALAAILALVAAAMSPVGRPLTPVEGRRPGRPLLLGMAGFGLMAGFDTAPMSWAGVLLAVALLVAAGSLLAVLSRSPHWSWRHLAAFTFGAVLARTLTGSLSPVPQGVEPAAKLAQNAVFLLAVLAIALAVLYRLAPDRDDPKMKWTSAGAVVAIVVWVLASVVFSLYVNNFGSYGKTYGALAGIVILLTWLWLTVVAILLGAEVNAETEKQTVKDTTTGPDKPLGERSAVKADLRPSDPDPDPQADDDKR